MNKVILMGRLTRDPEVRYSQGERAMAIARYTLAVDAEAAEAETETTAHRQRISFRVLHLTEQANSLRSIFIREPSS